MKQAKSQSAAKKHKQENKKSNQQYAPLSSTERKQIQAKVKQLQKGKKAPKSVQQTIPYDEMYADGICRHTIKKGVFFPKVMGTQFSKTIQFFDINYQLSTIGEQQYIFGKYCDFLNYFDNSTKFQLTFLNINGDDDDKELIVIPEQDDNFNEIRSEFVEMLRNQMSKGNNGLIRLKYVTFCIEESSYKTAKIKLEGIESELIANFKSMGVNAIGLNGTERLKVLHKILNPYSTDFVPYDWSKRITSGFSSKDFIAPSSMKFEKNKFRTGKAFGSSYSINILASELSDRVLSDILSIDGNIAVNMYLHSIDQIAATKLVKLKLSNIDRMKIDEQKKAARAGYDADVLPPDIVTFSNELKKMLDNLQTRNERLFIATIVLTNYSENAKDLALQNDKLTRIIQQHNCMIIPLDYRQDLGLASTLPLCQNQVEIERTLTTASVGIFVPFTTKEIFMDGEAIYYGLNALSNNLIMADRKRLKNPNGLILGTPGAGKSFTVKREILNSFLVSPDDIIICDPEGEYYPLVRELDGQLIKISSNSPHHINPMDIVINSQDDDPIGMKSEFILSLCELIVGGKYGLDSVERSIVDRCVRELYLNFFNNDPTPEKMPVLGDLHKALVDSGEKSAMRVANSLELYVSGSLNIFNNRTNVDLTNRIICFDIKELGNQLRKVGMLIVQDQVWNRVSLNREQHKSTRYYIDEFHLLLKEEQTAKYSMEIWKRFRKWGGIPTGITQNVKDLLGSKEIENILDNSDFICMLNQAAGDRDILAEKLKISSSQLQYVTNSGQGEGLIFYGDIILPFIDRFPIHTKMYKLMTTKPGES